MNSQTLDELFGCVLVTVMDRDNASAKLESFLADFWNSFHGVHEDSRWGWTMSAMDEKQEFRDAFAEALRRFK